MKKCHVTAHRLAIDTLALFAAIFSTQISARGLVQI